MFENFPKWSKIIKNGQGHKKSAILPDFNGIRPDTWWGQESEKIAIYGIFGPFWAQNTVKRSKIIIFFEKSAKMAQVTLVRMLSYLFDEIPYKTRKLLF